MKPAVKFFHLHKGARLREATRLKQFISQLFKREGKALGGLNYIFCSDKYLLQINRLYLRHDYYTDIITFDLSAPGEDTLGEIYISLDRVNENASNEDVSFTRELHRVIFHGALHLCGYKDKSKPDKLRMTQMEDKYLQLYFK